VEEGFVREVVSKVQTMRKEANFNVTDRIRVFHSGNEKIAEILSNNDISADVLAEEIVADEGGELSKEWNINGETVTLGVARV
jgi:isoleucyl-tRNA synthetase